MFNRIKQGRAAMRGEGEIGEMIAAARGVGDGTVLWAKVLSVESDKKDLKLVRLEVHDDERVYEIGSYTRIPRGEKLEVGDEVALVPENQTTRSDTKNAVSGGIADEVKSEAAFDLLPWWLPFGPKERSDKFFDNGDLPNWRIGWGTQPQFGRGVAADEG